MFSCLIISRGVGHRWPVILERGKCGKCFNGILGGFKLTGQGSQPGPTPNPIWPESKEGWKMPRNNYTGLISAQGK